MDDCVGFCYASLDYSVSLSLVFSHTQEVFFVGVMKGVVMRKCYRNASLLRNESGDNTLGD